MTDKNQELVTPEGLEKLQQELAYLTETRRKEVADRIRQASDFGDISENSEYDEAKNEAGLLGAPDQRGPAQDTEREGGRPFGSRGSGAVDLGDPVTLQGRRQRRTGADLPDRRRQRVRPGERQAHSRLPGRQRRPQEAGGGEGHGLHPPRRDGIRDRQRRGRPAKRRPRTPRFYQSSNHRTQLDVPHGVRLVRSTGFTYPAGPRGSPKGSERGRTWSCADQPLRTHPRRQSARGPRRQRRSPTPCGHAAKRSASSSTPTPSTPCAR